MTFEELGLSPEVLRAVAEAGYETPTPIQETAIPYVLMGRDVMGVAQTGTGKTASFTLPMIDILASGRAKARMPRSLILEPTRELAAQVGENFEKYGKYTRLTHALLIGGGSFKDQQALLERGVDVLIATPGRLLDLFERGNILLADTKTLVIDEADRMLDMGFIPDVERIVKLLPPLRQTLFFSATMAPEIRKLTEAFLMNPKEIRVAPPASPAANVTQRLVRCGSEPKHKRAALRDLIDRAGDGLGSGLIFCNRKRDVGIVYRSLQRHGYDAAELHGDMAQPARMETLDRFKKGEIRLLVCSDVAARGLDIPKVSHVFNFDVPSNAEDYVHRIGRTGRAGRSGEAFTLVTRLDFKLLSAIEKLIGSKILDEEAGEAEPGQVAARESETPVAETGPAETGAAEETTVDAAPAEERSSRRSGRRRGGRGRRKTGSADAPSVAAETIEAVEAASGDQANSGALNAAAQRSAEAGAQRARRRRGDAAPSDEAGQGRQGESPRRPEPATENRAETARPETRTLPPEARDTAFGADIPAFLLKRVPLTASS
ncbi:DEAD/DEAH box helicase [Algihabitans albus]|uniref:DEAD/DEAH box helicase n=1 Tax=Algihabitans albus TaxID=2164067 RepID=UPI000E5CC8CE|nr:DEAD/DEAH box helicase [Algihabitans albus]